MPARRTLSIKSERLTDLTPEELSGVAAGASGLPCVSGAACVSDWVISLCGCFTNYCSIDVC